MKYRRCKPSLVGGILHNSSLHGSTDIFLGNRTAKWRDVSTGAEARLVSGARLVLFKAADSLENIDEIGFYLMRTSNSNLAHLL